MSYQFYPNNKDPRTCRTPVMLSPKERVLLIRAAHQSHISISQFMRDAIREHIANQ